MSPAVVLVWGIGLALTAWLVWNGYVGYQTARVRAIASHVLEAEPALAGYPVHAIVEPRGRSVTLAGLVPTTEAGWDALRNLRAALPGSDVVNRTTALPTRDLDAARADIAALKTDAARARTASAEADAALGHRIGALATAVTDADQDLQGEIKGLAAELAQTARRADLDTLRAEIARATALSPRARLEAWIASNAIFFVKDTDYRNPKGAAGAFDALAALIKDTDVLVRVVGYTDEKGGEERNTPLSQARAQKVLAELTERGIPSSRLVAVGRNDSADLSPFIGDSSPNRRVEFEIGFAGEKAP